LRRLVSAVAVVAVIGTMPVANAARGPKPVPPGKACHDRSDGVGEVALKVDRKKATGRYALPSKAPTTLVVFAHGYGHDTRSWIEHMRGAARDHRVLAVTMDYRGTYEQTNEDGSETIRGWFVKEGAQDLIAAAEYFKHTCSSINETVLFSVSMGGNAAGLALASAGSNDAPDDSPLFDHWFNVEGAVNVIETYAGASLLAPVNGFAANAKADIEEEVGGTPADDPEGYADLAVVSHIAEIAASGVQGVAVIHAVEDGLVPYNQAREIAAELASEQIPTEFYTVIGKGDGESGTTLTGYSGNNSSPFAGHASEKSDTHLVMVTAFDRLWALVDEGAGFENYSEHPVPGI
jgi:hypothetical protein